MSTLSTIKRRSGPAGLILISALLVTACSGLSNREQRALTGGAVGAAGGAAVGAIVGNPWAGAAIGGAAGTAAGALMDEDILE